MRRIRIERRQPDRRYRSGFWNESPEDAMQPDDRQPYVYHLSSYGTVIGHGCYRTRAEHHGE